jgi:hypothetical protein
LFQQKQRPNLAHPRLKSFHFVRQPGAQSRVANFEEIEYSCASNCGSIARRTASGVLGSSIW